MIKNLLTFFKILFCFKIYIFHIVHYVLMPTFCSIYCKILKTKMICLFRIVLSTIYVSYHPKHLNNYQPEFEYHCIPVLYSSSISDYIMAYSMDYIISLQLLLRKKKKKLYGENEWENYLRSQGRWKGGWSQLHSFVTSRREAAWNKRDHLLTSNPTPVGFVSELSLYWHFTNGYAQSQRVCNFYQQALINH